MFEYEMYRSSLKDAIDQLGRHSYSNNEDETLAKERKSKGGLSYYVSLQEHFDDFLGSQQGATASSRSLDNNPSTSLFINQPSDGFV